MRRAGSDRLNGPTSQRAVWLTGNDWQDHTTNAFFALKIIALLVFLGCFVYSFRFSLFKADGKRDRLRTVGYKIACACAFIAYLFYTVEAGLSEARTKTTYNYFIVTVFSSLALYISDVLLFAIILRAPVQNTVTRVMKGAGVLNIILMIVVIAMNVGFYIMKIIWVVYTVGDDDIMRGLLFNKHQVYYSFALYSVYVVVALVAVVENGMVLAKDSSKGSIMMGAVVAPALLIRMVFNLASSLNLWFNSRGGLGSATQLLLAATFLDLILLAVMFVGIALAGFFLSRRPAPVKTQKEYDEMNRYIG